VSRYRIFNIINSPSAISQGILIETMEVHIIGAIHHNYCITIYCDSHDTGCSNLGCRVILFGGLDQYIAHSEMLYKYALCIIATSPTTHYDNHESQCLDTEYSILLIHLLQ
jgi:hypothetical protein